MPTLISVSLRASLTALAVAALTAGCASVDLGAAYNPPPARMPEPLPSARAATMPTARAQPVAPPDQAISSQPLPPLDNDAGTETSESMLAPLPQAAPADPPAAAVQSNLYTLTARLESAAVNPPARSAGNGQIDALYDANMNLLRWKASWSSLSGPITGIQFRGPADVGQNGPPAMIWPGPFGPVYEGRATLTPQQAQDLLGGLWYVNVSTASYPAGEMRGQLRVVH
jgi:hypothetical protein